MCSEHKRNISEIVYLVFERQKGKKNETKLRVKRKKMATSVK